MAAAQRVLELLRTAPFTESHPFEYLCAHPDAEIVTWKFSAMDGMQDFPREADVVVSCVNPDDENALMFVRSDATATVDDLPMINPICRPRDIQFRGVFIAATIHNRALRQALYETYHATFGKYDVYSGYIDPRRRDYEVEDILSRHANYEQWLVWQRRVDWVSACLVYSSPVRKTDPRTGADRYMRYSTF